MKYQSVSDPCVEEFFSDISGPPFEGGGGYSWGNPESNLLDL